MIGTLYGHLGALQLRAGDWNGQLLSNLLDLGHSLDARDLRGVTRAHVNLSVVYLNRGALGVARAHALEAASIADRHGAWALAQVAHNNLALIACDERRYEDAEEHALRVTKDAATRELAEFAESWAVLARVRAARGERSVDAALDAMDAAAEGPEAALCARTRAVFQPSARSALVAVLPSIDDPYERATTLLTLSLCSGDPEAIDRALSVLRRLGADPALERRRWSPRDHSRGPASASAP
ncbi:MAG: hypothetical protein AAGE52_42310 [Myxococcota bacterium]